jgi:hypothetical protein
MAEAKGAKLSKDHSISDGSAFACNFAYTARVRVSSWSRKNRYCQNGPDSDAEHMGSRPQFLRPVLVTQYYGRDWS